MVKREEKRLFNVLCSTLKIVLGVTLNATLSYRPTGDILCFSAGAISMIALAENVFNVDRVEKI
jgi:hypothetical protein